MGSSDCHKSTSNEDSINCEWKKIQKTTFTNWCNTVLVNQGLFIHDLYTDLCDGVILIKLYSTASGKKIDKGNTTPKLITHKLDNISLVLREMRKDGIKLINIDPFDISDGNSKLILALIWHMILNYHIGLHISDMSVGSNSKSVPQQTPRMNDPSQSPNTSTETTSYHVYNVTPKALLIRLMSSILPAHPINNLTTDWNSGKLLAGLVEKFSPGACPTYETWNVKNNLLNVTTALCLAEVHLGIPVLVEPQHMSTKSVDELSMITYLSSFTKEGGPIEKYMVGKFKQKFPSLAASITNMSTTWNDGLVLCQMIKLIKPMAFKNGFNARIGQMDKTSNDYYKSCTENLRLGMLEAKELFGIEPCAEVELMASPTVPPLIVMSYLSSFLHLPSNDTGMEHECQAEHLHLSLLSKNDTIRLGNSIKFMVSSDDITINPKDQLTIDVTYNQGEKTFKDVSLRQIWENDKNCYFEFKPLEIANYQVQVKFKGKPIQDSPYFTGVLYPIISEADIHIEELNKNVVTTGEVFTFMLHSKLPIESMGCCTENTVSKHRFNCQVVKMSDRIYKINAKIDSPGTYNVLFKPNNGVELNKTVLECVCCLKDNIKLLCSNEIRINVGEQVKFQVETRNAGKGTLGVKINGQTEDKPAITVDQNLVALVEKDGFWDVVIDIPESTTCSRWNVQFYWNKIHLPDKKVLIHTINAKNLKVSGSGLNQTIQIKLLQTFTVNTKECGAPCEIVGFFKRRRLSADFYNCPISFSPVANGVYEATYSLQETGSYYLKLFLNGNEVKHINNKIAGIDINQLKYEIVSKGECIGDKIDVKITIPAQMGKGDLFYAMEGPEGPMKVVVEPIFKDDISEIYLLSSIPRKAGEYKLILTFAGISIPGFPKYFSINEEPEIDLKHISLKHSDQTILLTHTEHEIEIFVNKNARKGNIVGYFVNLSSSNKEKQHIQFKAHETTTSEVVKFVGKYLTTTQGEVEVRIFYNSQEIRGSPFKKTFINTKSVSVREQNECSDNKISVGQRYLLSVSLPTEECQELLNASIVTPNGSIVHPRVGEFHCPKDTSSQKSDQMSNVVYQIDFTPEMEGKYIYHLSLLHHPIEGFPKILQAHNPEPAVPEENKIIVNMPSNVSYEIGKLCSIVVDARKCSPGDLMVHLFGPNRKPLQVTIEPIMNKGEGQISDCTKGVFQITFNLEQTGTHTMIVLWNDKRVPGCPFLINANSTLPEASLRNGAIADGYVGQLISVILDNVTYPIEEITFNCYDASRTSIPITIRPYFDRSTSYELNMVPKTPGMHQVEVSLHGKQIKGSPFYFKVMYPINPKEVKVFGMGIVSGVIDDEKGVFYVQTEQAGSGLLQVAVQGPKNGFNLTINNKEEGFTEINPYLVKVDYKPSIAGLYVINILWSGEQIPGSPFKIYNCLNEKELKGVNDGRVPAHFLLINSFNTQDAYAF